MTRILVFGDSIPYGYYDKEGGWVERLRILFLRRMIKDENFDYPIYNLIISGDYTKDVLRRFESEARERLHNEEGIIIYSIGENDSQLLNKERRLIVSPEELKANIEKLINISRKFTKKVLFVGLTPVDEPKVNPVLWRTEISYKNEYIEKYDKIIESICRKNKIPFIKIFHEWLKSDYKNMLEDGLHPNSKGHTKIFEIVKDFLIKKKII